MKYHICPSYILRRNTCGEKIIKLIENAGTNLNPNKILRAFFMSPKCPVTYDIKVVHILGM